MSTNSKANPGGCVIGFVGLLSWLYMGVCMYILFQTNELKQDMDTALDPDKMRWHAILAFLIGLLAFVVGAKLSFAKDFRLHPYSGEGY